MSIEVVIEQIKQKFSYAPQVNAKIKLDFGNDGVVFIDATVNPPEIIQGDEAKSAEPDTTLVCPIDLFKGFIAGTSDPNISYMMGKLKVKGSLGIAMKLNSILEG